MPSQNTIRQFYNDFASIYEATFSGAKANVQYMNEAAKIFQKHRSERQGSILDLGCGTGLLKELLSGEFEYTGVDIAENMLAYASQRGYKTIHQPIEETLPEIPDFSYDFVFALSSLLFVEDIDSVLREMNRIACQSILLSFDEITNDYLQKFALKAYNHSQVSILNAKEDYWITGWTSVKTGITIRSRMIYIEL